MLVQSDYEIVQSFSTIVLATPEGAFPRLAFRAAICCLGSLATGVLLMFPSGLEFARASPL